MIAKARFDFFRVTSIALLVCLSFGLLSLSITLEAEEPAMCFDVPFDSDPAGPLDSSIAALLFGPLEWATLEDRATIVEASGGDRKLEVLYPKGEFGSQRSGASFVSRIEPVGSLFLEYSFQFSPDFPFMKGGKLPGLASGGSKYTGGRQPSAKLGGWSARLMWRGKGKLELYLYHPKMGSKYGERHDLGVIAQPGKEYRVRLEVDTGSAGQSNGSVSVALDGDECLRLSGLLLSGEIHTKADSFLFSTFFGGSGESWAPSEDCTVRFDRFQCGEMVDSR